MIKKIIKISLVTLFIISPFLLSTSKGAGMGTGPPLPCGGPFTPCAVPLDGGISLLVLAGVAYGGKKIYDSTKKNPN